jgi:hypothetical protein
MSALFIFTYSDYCEMPLMLEKIMGDYPFAFYMFIPAQFVREAFREMTLIFERQEKRIQYFAVKSNRESTEGKRNMVVTTTPFDFLTLVQGTLMATLGCPIPVIAPAY